MRLELYRRYLEAEPDSGTVGRFMSYDWVEMPGDIYGILATYSFMLDDFARELANAVNAFTVNIRRLKTWTSLLPTLDKKARREAIHEFVEPISTLALLSPYMLRSRFLYATAHLCHQVNLIRESDWGENALPMDGEIWFEAADRQGKPWKAYRPLKLRMERMAGKALSASTADFRNAFSHRFSARIGEGITNFAERKFDNETGSFFYTFGGTSPLDPSKLVELLSSELDRSYDAFGAFQALVAEHLEFIVPLNKEMLDSMNKGSSS
ncbi:MAG: hypothetical protein AB7E24_11985 [Novosphingobium sp.]